jgi:site-specific DNA-methyltransferase (adenine-specific)
MTPTWQLDLADARSFLPNIDPNKIDVVISDPPYGIALKTHSKGHRRYIQTETIQGDANNTLALLLIKWAETHNKPLVIFCSPYNIYPGKWRDRIIWNKGGGVGGGGHPLLTLRRTYELILTQRTKPTTRAESVWTHAIGRNNFELHPNQKPLSLMLRLVETYTQPNQTVLDPFAGSATTAIACMETNRQFIGCEIDPKYYARAIERLKNHDHNHRQQRK